MGARHPSNVSAGWEPAAVEEIAVRLGDQPGALMPVLHAVQARFGYIPSDAVPLIARALNLSRAEVHGVVSFYHDFRKQPPGRHVIRVCRAESCQAMGAVALAEHVQNRLGITFGQNSRDNEFTLEPVYCLGNCACSPALVIGDEIYGRVTPALFDRLVARIKESS
jgi:formate dehydrogenase subunit gamma